jgi:nucleoside-diphosphate-sugar epimerase
MTADVVWMATGHPETAVFYASSACTYPVERQTPIDANGGAPCLTEDLVGMGTPDACYGAEKLHGLRLFAKVPNARVGILHTVYGPLQEHEGRRMKFPAAVATKAIAARETGTLELWGDGEQLRSYLHVDDAIDRILTVTFADHYAGPVNIGSDRAVSCREIAEMCLRIAGAEGATITTNPAEPSGVLARNCSNAKFTATYGPVADRGYEAGFTDMIGWLDSL